MAEHTIESRNSYFLTWASEMHIVNTFLHQTRGCVLSLIARGGWARKAVRGSGHPARTSLVQSATYLAVSLPFYHFCVYSISLFAMLLALGIALLYKKYHVHAVPVSTSASTFAMPVVPLFSRDDSSNSDGCDSRTVLDILWSCLATTFACTWVSVHPNLPFRGEGKWSILKRRLFLMFFSVLAPEMMIMWAFKQWRGAVMIKNAVNNALPGPSQPWTTVHGHFLQMGGFRVVMMTGEDQTWILHDYHLNDEKLVESVLTFKAFSELLSRNLIAFPTITEDEIDDRSKGDALSKGIAFLQLTWFIVQILTRAVQGLAITELELTTAALAGLNSVMYIFWWNKPLAIRYPVIIRSKGVEKLMAEQLKDAHWDFSGSEFHLRKYLRESTIELILDTLEHTDEFLRSLPERLRLALSKLAATLYNLPSRIMQRMARFRQVILRRLTGSRSSDRTDKDSESVHDDAKTRKVSTISVSDRDASDLDKALAIEVNGKRLTDSPLRQILHTLAKYAKLILNYSALPFSFVIHLINLILFIPITRILPPDDLIDSLPFGFDTDGAEKTMGMIFYSEDTDATPLLCSSSVAGALFGMIHCLAWHFIFPSHVEQIMWRVASLCVVGACTFTFIGVFTLDPLLKAIDGFNRSFKKALELTLFVFFVLIPLVYPVARISLLVLAVTSLRSLPSSAFDTVRWVELVPHI